MLKIIILSGVPGSGKSTWANWYIKHNWNSAIVSRDDIRENYFPHPYVYTGENEEKVTEIFDSQVTKLMDNGWEIILDNTHASDYWLNTTLNKCKALSFRNGYKVYIKFFDVPLWKAQWRVRRRFKKTGKVVPAHVVRNMHKSYKKIDKFKYADSVL
jgi:predicted kinase